MNDEINLSKDFRQHGFVIQKNIVPPSWFDNVRTNMLSIMQPYCDNQNNDSCDASLVDELFLEISAKGQTAKANVYSIFGQLADLPLILGIPSVRKVIKRLGFKGFTIQAYSVFCLEPGNEKHKFLPHQDLKGRTSFKSLILWVPLTAGKELGGMACWPGSHKKGPLVHTVAASGQLQLPSDDLIRSHRLDLSNYDVGDVIFMDPYLVHETIGNNGNSIRWTAIIKIDDINSNSHLLEGKTPFIIEDFINTKSNAERLQIS